MIDVLVKIDGSGTYPRGLSTYTGISQDEAAKVVAAWMKQRDVAMVVLSRADA